MRRRAATRSRPCPRRPRGSPERAGCTAPGADGALRGSLPHLPRQHHRQRRAGRHAEVAPHGRLQPAVDRRRLHAGVRGADADRRHARRSARTQEDHARRRRPVLCRLTRGRPRERPEHADHRTGRHGGRRRGLRAGDAVADPPDLHRRAPACAGPRRVDVGLGDLARGRARARRPARRRLGLAGNLLVQPRLRAAGTRRCRVDAPGELRPSGQIGSTCRVSSPASSRSAR